MTKEDQPKDALWGAFVKNVKPLKKSNNKVIQEAPSRDSNGNITIHKKASPILLQERIWQGETAERWAHQQVQQLTLKEIKKKNIEGRIDLHGYTLAGAESALTRFFNWAQTSNLHFVLVITGKGGVLNEATQQWLNQHPEYVVSFNKAQPKDGGAGAFYVHVRRMRK